MPRAAMYLRRRPVLDLSPIDHHGRSAIWIINYISNNDDCTPVQSASSDTLLGLPLFETKWSTSFALVATLATEHWNGFFFHQGALHQQMASKCELH